MAPLTRAQLKALWIQGYTPTQSDYDDVWDSFSNLSDDDLYVLLVGDQTISGKKTFSDNLKVNAQAHGGAYIKPFSAAATFSANDGNYQEMEVTADTTIEVQDALPGTYIFTLIINSVANPVITIGTTFGEPVDNNPTLLDSNGDKNIITLIVRPGFFSSPYYALNTITF